MTPFENVGTSPSPHSASPQEAQADNTRRDELVLEHLPVVNAITRNLAGKLPVSVDADDVYGAGITGLMDAAERFDANRQVRFRTYAEVRVRGAIRDYLRSLSWAPRRLHGRARELSRVRQAIEETNGRSGSVAELAQAMGMTLDQYHALVMEINAIEFHHADDLWSDDAATDLGAAVADKSADPSREMERKEMIELIRQALDRLSERQKVMLWLYYYEELTMKEVGAIMNVTESRASQIHSKALAAMKRELLGLGHAPARGFDA